VQWGLVVGFLIAQRVLSSVADAHPAWSPYIWTLLYCYIAFALMTWIAYPLFNLLLRLDRFGRLALDEDQTRGANWLGLCLFTALAYLVAALSLGAIGWYMLMPALVFGLLCVPVSAIWRCSQGWPRQVMLGVTLLMLVMGLVLCVPVDALPRRQIWSELLILLWLGIVEVFPYAFIGSQFLGSYLMSVQVRK
jgi:hypothetical protein